MAALSLLLLSLATPSLTRTPIVPTVTYLYSVNLTMPTPLHVGMSPLGNRTVYRMTGGTFEGPKLKGLTPQHSARCLSPYALTFG